MGGGARHDGRGQGGGRWTEKRTTTTIEEWRSYQSVTPTRGRRMYTHYCPGTVEVGQYVVVVLVVAPGYVGS